MRIQRAPILLVQWGPERELDEVSSIEERYAERAPALQHGKDYNDAVEVEAFRESIVRSHIGYDGDALQDWYRAEEVVRCALPVGHVLSLRVTAPDADELEDQFAALLKLSQNAQTLYFSCHGSRHALAFDRAGRVSLSFERFGRILDSLCTSSVTLVLGCCYGLDHGDAILEHIPAQVSRLYGFTHEPSAFDVANLMLGLLGKDDELFEALTSESARLTAGGLPLDEMYKVEDAFRQIVDARDPIDTPTQMIQGSGGVAVRQLRRVRYNGKFVWQGRPKDLDP